MQGDLKAAVEGKKDENALKFQSKGPSPSLGIYTHVPFCATACDFCAFYQVQTDRSGIERYLRTIKSEVSLRRVDRPVDTFFWGGGTPGLLASRDLEYLCQTLTDAYGAPRREWTVEMAPSTVKADKLRALKDYGVTRISMGVQSFDDALLEKLGRQHSSKQIYKAYDLIRSADFESVNLDLIFAIPGQDDRRLSADIENAAILEPDHVSTYCLTFEEDTALFARLSEGKIAIDSDREAGLYRSCWDSLARYGYKQYEISNFAKPGRECLHNLNTWRMQDWLGLGPSAASQWAGRRFSNAPDLDLWRKGIERGEPRELDVADVTPTLLLEDAIIFGLRMNEGIDLETLETRFGCRVSRRKRAVLERLEREGKALRSGSRFRLSAEGRLLADAIGEALLSEPN